MATDFIDEPFDDEEKGIMEAIERGDTRPIPREELDMMRKEIAGSAAKVVSIRIQGEDLRGIRRMAKEAGMPYQTLINSVIHRYVNGGIVPKTPI